MRKGEYEFMPCKSSMNRENGRDSTSCTNLLPLRQLDGSHLGYFRINNGQGKAVRYSPTLSPSMRNECSDCSDSNWTLYKRTKRKICAILLCFIICIGRIVLQKESEITILFKVVSTC